MNDDSEGGVTTLFFRVGPNLGSGIVYAIIRDRGTQYRVEEGQLLNVALMDGAQDGEFELGEVLVLGGDTPLVGAPIVDGAKVFAKVVSGLVKGDKIVVFKYKNKKRYRRRTGHRQKYTRVAISRIVNEK